jgi:16S rRNA G966 N2-methylase RsmD
LSELAERPGAELDQLASEIRELWLGTTGGYEMAIDAQFEIGYRLRQARERLPSDNDFGTWFRGQGFRFTQQWAWMLRWAAEHDELVRPAVTSQLVTGRGANLEKAVKEARRSLGLTRKRVTKEIPEHPPVVYEASWEDWLPGQPDCDLLLTDPPYSTDVEDVESFAAAWLPLALKKVKPTGRAYVCIGAYPRELAAYLALDPGHLTLSQVLVWEYRNTLGPSPTHDYKLNWQAILYYRGPDAPPLDCPEMVEQFTVQDLNAPDGRLGDRYHAWQKPDKLGDRLVRHATQPGQLVLDPFSGTGAFLLAAARLDCEALGCEIDPEMLTIAAERGCQVAG